MIPFTLRQLSYFVAISDHGGISEAARALNVSQPALSAAISQLEELLQARLLGPQRVSQL